MWKFIGLLLYINFEFNFAQSNNTSLYVPSMKNDLKKSVKKVLDAPSPPTTKSPLSSGNNSSLASFKQGIDALSNVTSNNSSTSKNTSIPIEGGGVVHVSSNHTSGKMISSSTPSTLSPKPPSQTESTLKISVPFEGGGSIHLEEHNTTLFHNKSTAQDTNPSILVPPVENSTERKISARKGVVFEPPSNNTSSTTTSSPIIISSSAASITESTTRRHKPKFAMIIGDHESKERKSFIESPTTGKDYIFPIVLFIMALPLVFLIIKLIYKRGSEYTERRHYDRMYLIDGMYNTR